MIIYEKRIMNLLMKMSIKQKSKTSTIHSTTILPSKFTTQVES